jgi:hypothetical protein
VCRCLSNLEHDKMDCVQRNAIDYVSYRIISTTGLMDDVNKTRESEKPQHNTLSHAHDSTNSKCRHGLSHVNFAWEWVPSHCTTSALPIKHMFCRHEHVNECCKTRTEGLGGHGANKHSGAQKSSHRGRVTVCECGKPSSVIGDKGTI